MRRPSRVRGFTIAELITVVAILAILSAVALPVTRFAARRQKEEELRSRLQRLTSAIDRYNQLSETGVIVRNRELTQGTFPKTLDELAQPIELVDGKRITLLRERDLIDPMTGRNDWRTISSTDSGDSAFTNGDNVWDVRSSSTALALDGETHYDEW